jgi:methylated-DNA-[protein]-cysteine S-methyltransferase
MNRKGEKPIGVTVCQTAYGWVGIAWSERGLVALTLPEASEAAALSRLPAGSAQRPADPPSLDIAILCGKLQAYFRGDAVDLNEPLDSTIGTRFQQQVWAITRAIPRGQTLTYSQIARQAGSPGAARAVGQSMARNPWPIVVPCHRVVGSDGSLTGFGGGIDMKRRMLEMEGARLQLPGLSPPEPGPDQGR